MFERLSPHQPMGPKAPAGPGLKRARGQAHDSQVTVAPKRRKRHLPLPPELMQRILHTLAPGDDATVRALSQCNRSLEAVLARLEPARLQQAHAKTLEKALRRHDVDLTNPRAARLLAAMADLTLLSGPRPSAAWPCSFVEGPQDEPLPQLAAALPKVRTVTSAIDPRGRIFRGLLAGGLNTSLLTAVHLQPCFSLIGPDLTFLHQVVRDCPNLQHVTFPQLQGDGLWPTDGRWTAFDFSPWPNLTSFVWNARHAPPIKDLDFNNNRRLKTLSVVWGGATFHQRPDHRPGWDWEAQRVRLSLPDSLLESVRLGTLELAAGSDSPLHAPVWRQSVRTLWLDVRLLPGARLDLSGFGALEALCVASERLDLRRVCLPEAAPLTDLQLEGLQLQAMFDQLARRVRPLLRRLGVAPERWLSGTYTVPWAQMPNLTQLSFTYKDQISVSFAQLRLPVDNGIEQLVLRREAGVSPRDRAPMAQALPALVHLDVVELGLAGDFVHELSQTLHKGNLWPKFERLSLCRVDACSGVGQSLLPVARRHNFTVVAAPFPASGPHEAAPGPSPRSS